MDFILVLIVLCVFSFSNMKIIKLGRYIMLVYYFYAAHNYYIVGNYSGIAYLTGIFMLLFLPKILRFIFILKTNRRYYQ
ncbi:hypothetical protein [Clostridium perfringens]|uniref:hypothetical protein n=1 Tax=Clostridium perfringens TaxID=1502 RepID=UPI001FACB13B|nr:hypothetical protein [Clostridium perfringens]MDT7914752.1 hypothetical protein [Clostridium perfringens]MDT7927716.1 hypothetical protein [Clostridium perfringens]MDT7960030.1 hypothetical protein [Clostridium perfringens]MDT7976620.1 hypothetical protein [Clostridium perfringens]MDT7979780.1 hypothetical protein [Clostridium perfringens]